MSCRMALFGLPLVVLAAVAPALAAGQDALAGSYDGGQPEIVAALVLEPEGRFRYALSSGAVDEKAEGTWIRAEDTVMLTSDPVKPPSLTIVERRDAPSGLVEIDLELPSGLTRQYFDAEFLFADGRTMRRQLGEGGLEHRGETPVAVTLRLPMFDLSSGPVRLPGPGGHRLRFRFEPNDLLDVAFARTPLRIDGADLILERHDRAIRFRRLNGSGGAPARPSQTR